MEEAIAAQRTRLLLTQELGESHPETLATMLDLADTLKQKNGLDEAESMERQAWSLAQEALGDEHPDTLTCMNNVAVTLFLKGSLDKSAAMFRECWLQREEVLGIDHDDTLESKKCLLHILKKQGKDQEARLLEFISE